MRFSVSSLAFLLATMLTSNFCSASAGLVTEGIKSNETVVPRISKSEKETFALENFQALISACQLQNNVIVDFRGAFVLCLHGSLDASDETRGKHRKFDLVYINSPGGDLRSAMKLGREIFANGAYGIVDQHCHSACGTYIIPSLKRLIINDDTVISMHTNLPRTPNDFVKTRYPREYSRLKKNVSKSGPTAETVEQLLALASQYDDFYKKFVIAEIDFFKAINTDVSYTIRYREIFRTLEKRKDYRCKPEGGLHLIIGPRYLDEFNIKAIRSWFPTDKAEYAALLQNTSETDTIIYDFDDHPFWLPDRGFVQPQDCQEL
ncbi:MAG: hypothetical protein AAGH57_12970 [Pseudomonadota bacterium]